MTFDEAINMLSGFDQPFEVDKQMDEIYIFLYDKEEDGVLKVYIFDPDGDEVCSLNPDKS